MTVGSTERSTVITGLGFVTPIGNDRATVAANLRDGRHGLSPVVFLENPNLPVKVAGTIKDFDVRSPRYNEWSWPARYEFPRETLRGLAPHGLYALCAVTQALDDSGTTKLVEADDRTGLFCASAGSAMMLHHHVAQMHAVKGERGNPMGVVSSIAGTLNFNLAAHFRITGAVCGFVSACASSSHALGYAVDAIKLGRLDRAIVVGAEEDNAETLLPFAAMRAVSRASDPRQASRPFDVGRDGFVGAGGAVALIIEAAETAAARGAAIYGEIIGWAQTADGHSVAMSHPDGAGLRRAMAAALEDAGVTPTEVDYVNAHATSTPVGDRAEAIALQAVFSSIGAAPEISSTKGLTGHPLSMSGVMEAAFCAIALREGFMPGNAHLIDPDPACAGLRLPVQTSLRPPRIILTNSSGFGGSNVCHVLRRWAPPPSGLPHQSSHS